MGKILVIDDDLTTCNLLNKFLSKHGFTVITTTTAKKAIEYLNDIHDFDAVLCDLRLENGDGKDILLRSGELYSDLPVIIITGFNDLKTAVNIMKLGAYDYILKPIIPDEMLSTIEHAMKDRVDKIQPKSKPAEEIPEKENAETFTDSEEYISAQSKAFQTIMEQMGLVALTDYSVIIYGESGVGKEAIAQEIHKRSRRRNHPFMAIDCGALQKELSGSELFGHEKGALTGAVSQKNRKL